MKCPYLTDVLIRTRTTHGAGADVTEGSHNMTFKDCIKDKCPAYFSDEGGEICLRVEGGLK